MTTFAGTTGCSWAPEGKERPGRQETECRERVEGDQMAVMEGCNSVCKKPRWLELDGWP